VGTIHYQGSVCNPIILNNIPHLARRHAQCVDIRGIEKPNGFGNLEGNRTQGVGTSLSCCFCSVFSCSAADLLPEILKDFKPLAFVATYATAERMLTWFS